MKFLMLSIALVALFCCHNASAGHNDDATRELIPNPEALKKDTTIQSTNKYFPFELSEAEGQFIIVAPIEGKDLYPKYYDFFKKYGYEGNGPCWEGHIRQILRKKDAALLKHLTFDSEAGGFFAYTDSKDAQQRFVDILSPIFSNLDTLSVWVKNADRSKIDD